MIGLPIMVIKSKESRVERTKSFYKAKKRKMTVVVARPICGSHGLRWWLMVSMIVKKAKGYDLDG